MSSTRSFPYILLGASLPLLGATLMLRHRRKRLAEAVVKEYFEGVNLKDSVKIEKCFRSDGEPVKLRDVCGAKVAREATPRELAQRCMDFVTAHPDCKVRFHYGPSASYDSDWVVAHWYETGNWSADSCEIPAKNQPMKCEGQTRFLVDSKTNRINEFVVTRTFTEWEIEFIRGQKTSA